MVLRATRTPPTPPPPSFIPGVPYGRKSLKSTVKGSYGFDLLAQRSVIWMQYCPSSARLLQTPSSFLPDLCNGVNFGDFYSLLQMIPATVYAARARSAESSTVDFRNCRPSNGLLRPFSSTPSALFRLCLTNEALELEIRLLFA